MMAGLTAAPVRVMAMMNFPTTPPRRVPSVLIASDDPVARTILSRQLKAAGNQVRCADSPVGALMAMRLEIPDLVVLQPGPKFSGPILYQRLRSHPETRDVPVVLVTAPAALEQFVTKPEPALFVGKPVQVEALAARVQRLMQVLPLARGCEIALHAA
jgi:CheY-like chemotaxis protein